jgi:monoterpene epsilon-lactone hydrolase
MASPESKQLSDLYRSWVAAQAAQPDMTLAQMRQLFGHWGDVTGEPGGVDYIEVDAGGVAAMWVAPRSHAPDRVLVCAHGGGYIAGSIYTHRKLYGHLAKAIGCRALAVDYRLAPEHPVPAQVEDMVRVYRWLLSAQGVAPERIALLGDSAGAALVLTTITALRSQGLPLPAAAMPLSLWAGADTSSPSYDTNKDSDVLVTREMSQAIGQMALGPSGNLRDPLSNPLAIDFAGYPPLYLQVGAAEVVLDDSTRVAAMATRAGVSVKIDAFSQMQHCFQLLAGTAPEADDAVARLAAWVGPLLGLA